MKEMQKGSIKTLAVVVLAALVAGGVFVYSKSGTLSEEAVREAATNATKVATDKSKEVMEEKKAEVLDAGKEMLDDKKAEIMEKTSDAVDGAVDKAVMEGKEAIGAAVTGVGEGIAAGNTVGSFEDYTPEKIGSNEKVVLDFAADWCPSCRAFEKNVTANAAEIPSDVTILKVDYDNQKDLIKKYGVRIQHTFVQVDENGEEIAKWTGGNTLEHVLAKLQ